YEGALADLRRQGGAGYRLRTTDDSRALAIAAEAPGIEHARSDHQGVDFQADERAVAELSLALGRAGVGILALAPQLATLEDLFFRLTERNGDGEQAPPAPMSAPPGGEALVQSP